MAFASTMMTDAQECVYKYQLSRLPKGWLDGLGNEEDKNVNANTSAQVGDEPTYAENTQIYDCVGIDDVGFLFGLPTYKELFDGVVDQLATLISSWNSNSNTDFGIDGEGNVDGELSLFRTSTYPIGYEQSKKLEDKEVVRSPLTMCLESPSNSQNSSMNTSFGAEYSYEYDQQQQQYIYDYNYNQNQHQQQGELMQGQGQGYDNYGGDVGYGAQQAQQHDQWQQYYDYNGYGYYNNYDNYQNRGMGRGYGYAGNANGHGHGSSSGSNRGRRESQEFIVKYRKRSHKIPRPSQSQKQ